MNTQGGSVLIVDDTPANLRLLTQVLRENGYRPRAVTSGKLALMAVRHQVPDIVLLDINMPVMDGYACCRALKALPECADVPVLFLSARSEPIDKIEAFEAGGVDFVTKPIEFDELLARVGVQVEMRRLRLALQSRNEALESSLAREREMERRRDNLVHMVAHDMRAPLTVISASLDMAQLNLIEADAQPDPDLAAAARSTDTLRQLIDDLLDVSRLEAGLMPVTLGACDLNWLTERVVAAHNRVSEVPVRIDGYGEVQGDAVLVERVLTNLIHNAAKFSPTDAPIVVRIETDKVWATVTVIDRGPGVAQTHQQVIFDKFGQAPGGASRMGSTGLGLTFCKLAVEALGGSIGLHCPPGEGCSFWFKLPVDAAEDAAEDP